MGKEPSDLRNKCYNCVLYYKVCIRLDFYMESICTPHQFIYILPLEWCVKKLKVLVSVHKVSQSA
jgi:hypothetical protein